MEVGVAKLAGKQRTKEEIISLVEELSCPEIACH
jgi:hypothetical protein